MPYISIQLSKPASATETQALANGMTEIMSGILRKKRELVAVSIDSIPAPQWFIGGQSLTEQGAVSAFVSARITEGTNTLEEKAQAIAAIHTLLSDVVGTLAEASYIVLECLPATDWGYSGKTQASRKA